MTFLNLILLGGAGAALIPFLIHMLHRSRPRAVPWAAMHLLRMGQARRRRSWIEQWILLAVRMAILLTLALCMARPVLTGMRSLLGGTQSTVAALVDNSLSMGTREAGRTRLARAGEETLAVMSAAPRGSELAAVWMAPAGAAAVGPTFDPARVRAAFQASKGGYGEANPAAALTAAAEALAKGHYSDRELLVVSDFQKANWTGEARAAWSRAVEALRREPLAPRIFFLPMAKEKPENLAVESVSLSRAVAGVGQRVQARVTVKNYGATARPDARVFFRVDGAERSNALVSVAAGGTGQAIFNHTFESAGSHVLEAAVEADALPADDARRVSVIVWERLPALLVSDDAGDKAGDTLFLEAALQPFKTAGESGGDLIDAKTLTLARAGGAAPDFSGYRVVVLVNLREIPGQWLKPLEAYVRAGGGLLIFPGERTRADGWRRQYMDKNGRFLPAWFDKPAGMVNKKKDEGQPVGIAAQSFDHPALAMFNAARGGGLGGGAIRIWSPLRVDTRPPVVVQVKNNRRRGQAEEEPPAPEGKVTAPARLESGDPLLVEKTYGRGRVAMCAVACDDSWSNLPARPFYLPLMQQLAVHLALRSEPPRTVEVGAPLAMTAAGAEGDEPGAARLVDPQGAAHEVKAAAGDGGAVYQFDQTWTPGTYALELAGGKETVRFAVNTPARESDTALLDRSEIEALAREAGGQVIGSAQEAQELERRRRFGVEIWKPLLALVLGLVFLELALEQRFARRTAP